MAVTFTDNEAWFLRVWKRSYGGTPRDWSEREMNAGTSSFLDYRDWLARHERTISKDLVERFFEGWKPTYDRKTPALRELRDWYRDHTRAKVSDAAGTGRARCRQCHGAGLLVVLVGELKQGGVRLIKPDCSLAPGSFTRTYTSTVPCHCTDGDRVNQRMYHYDATKSAKLRSCAWDSTPAMLDMAARLNGTPFEERPEIHGRVRDAAAAIAIPHDHTATAATDDDRATVPVIATKLQPAW